MTVATEIAALLDAYEIGSDDLRRIRAFGALVRPRLAEYVTLFYGWLAGQPEFEVHFADRHRLERVQRLQTDYWADFFEATVDDRYFARRDHIGEAHARIGLPLPVYFAAMNKSLIILTERLYDGGLDAWEYAESVRAIVKLIHLDTAIIVETYSRLTSKKIADQSQALMEMSTPVTLIWEGILMLPVVGLIDSRRAQDIRTAMLSKIAETRSRVFILDISGVAVVDTAVADHLIKITKSTKLMGCDCTVSGVSPSIAETMVDLGIDVGDVRTTSTLRDALEDAFVRLGVDLHQRHAAAPRGE
jgi:rsbT co-antagonist protein RsbR